MKPSLIVALDVDSFTKAKKLVDALCPVVKIFKVGSQLFTAAGPKIVEYIRKKGAEVFLDLKFHDIPNTVASAVIAATWLNVLMLTVHASGGSEMMAQAQEAAKSTAKKLRRRKPKIIAVTILTSQAARPDRVLGLARKAIDCGLDGVVCSVREAKLLRQNIKKDFVIVTPGIRPESTAKDDQRRTATVCEAIAAGSDFMVVGRPIVEAPDPLKAAKEFIQ
ncbi:MAG: orotidine-5'-phosphate decarboxylase [Candidatus Omnitrophota bacterium]